MACQGMSVAQAKSRVLNWSIVDRRGEADGYADRLCSLSWLAVPGKGLSILPRIGKRSLHPMSFKLQRGKEDGKGAGIIMCVQPVLFFSPTAHVRQVCGFFFFLSSLTMSAVIRGKDAAKGRPSRERGHWGG